MNYDEKIKELEDRIIVLENKEKQRKIWAIVKVVVFIFFIIGISLLVYFMMKPYISQVKDLYSTFGY